MQIIYIKYVLVAKPGHIETNWIYSGKEITCLFEFCTYWNEEKKEEMDELSLELTFNRQHCMGIIYIYKQYIVVSYLLMVIY